MATPPAPPPNLPIPSSGGSTPQPAGVPAGAGLPMAGISRGTDGVIPPAPVVSASLSDTLPLTPGGGVDAPDPFIARSPSPLPSATLPPVPRNNGGGLGPPVNVIGSTTALGAGNPSLLAPSAFSRPRPPRRNRRLIILVSGTVVILLLLAALGLVLARFFLGGDSATPSPTTTPSTATTTTPTLAPTTSTSATPTASDQVLDVDDDGLTAAEERFYGTNSEVADSDSDGFNDGDEVRAGYDPLGPGKLDSDSDGFPDPDERSFGTDPFNPDTDSDGFSDGAEIKNGFNPLIPSPGDKL